MSRSLDPANDSRGPSGLGVYRICSTLPATIATGSCCSYSVTVPVTKCLVYKFCSTLSARVNEWRLNIARHKSYHPYLESNKQKVRDDEARARLDEELREQTSLEEVRFDQPCRITNGQGAGARLEYLRRKAADPAGEHSYEGFAGTGSAGSAPGPSRLIESHRTMKAKADKKKEKEIMNFDWPSETKRKEERRAAKGKDRVEEKVEEDNVAGLREGEHFNFWADIEKTVSLSIAFGS